MNDRLVYVVILNWNGWADTLECLESVFRSNYHNYRVIVCDNNSHDGSVAKIVSWADGLLNVYVGVNNKLRSLSWPPVVKPIKYQLIVNDLQREHVSEYNKDLKLTIIKTGGNLGFAGGNNVGIRYAAKAGDNDFIWLLNNDAVSACDSLTMLVKTMEDNPSAGICGSTLVYYSDPDKVQVAGGVNYNKWLGIGRKLCAMQSIDSLISNRCAVSDMSYVEGASMFVSKEFVKKIGLLNEEYFLYFEEIDWAVRSRGQFGLAYSRDSIVYHKEGASIGSSCNQAIKSNKAEFFFMKSRIIFTRKYYPVALLTVYFSMCLALLNRLRRRQWSKIFVILSIFCGAKEYSCCYMDADNGSKKTMVNAEL